MRLSIFLAAVSALCALASASDSPKGTSLYVDAGSRVIVDTLDGSSGIIPTELATSGDTQRDPYHRYMPNDRERVVTCLKMRAYFMAREDRESDVTHMVGYATCMPSSKYEVRTTMRPLLPASH